MSTYAADNQASNTPAAPPTTTSPKGGIIQTPDINPRTGKPEQRSIRDAAMARDVCKTLVQACRNRNIVSARILAKYNAERPYDQVKLEAEGLGWRSNFTTKPLPSLIEKVYPRFVDAVNGLKYLTSASLSDKWQNSVEKSDKFRSVITKTIRTRRGWRNLVEDVSLINSLFGHAVVAWLDEFTWMPCSFKQDESFVSDGTRQEVSKAQVILLKEQLLPHELFDLIKDPEAAKTAGWNLAAVRKSINNASPSQLRDTLNVGGTLETWYQNAWREMTVGASYMAGASVVVVYNLLVREVTGKVSHYRLGGVELDELFSRDDHFDSMEECASFYSFQKGNNTLHGSKGVGRDIYEMAAMQDRIRNEIVDRMILSGKTLIQGDPKKLHTFKMSVVGSTVILPANWTVLEQKIDGNVEGFLKLDAYMGMLVDQLIGSTTPRTFQGERVTAAEVNLFAAREEEGKDTKIGRFLEQFADMIGTMQRRICDPDTVEDDAKEAQKELLESMTREELDELAASSIAETVRDLTPAERQMTVAVATEKKGNPLYNQRQLEVEDVTARLGSDFAGRVILPENDPTVQAEQQRLQQFELALLTQGQPVPVSVRDNHEIHLEILMPLAQKTGEGIMAGQVGSAVFEVVVAHIGEHYNRAVEQGADKKKLKPVADFLKKALPAIEQMKAMDAQAQQISESSAAHDDEEAALQAEEAAMAGAV